MQTVIRSIYSPTFYAGVAELAFRRALWYFLALILPLALIRAAPFAVGVFTELNPGLESWARDAVHAYPRELELRIRNGQVSTNVDEPYFIPSSERSGKSNLVVIDTRTPFSAAQYQRYDTYVWLTRDALIIREGERQQMRIIELSQLDDLTINRRQVTEWMALITPWLAVVGPVLVILAVPALYVAYLVRLLYLLLAALPILLIAKLVRFPLTYGQSYKVGLFAMTGALLVELAVGLSESWLGFRGFPFMFTILTCIVAGVNLYRAGRSSTPTMTCMVAAR